MEYFPRLHCSGTDPRDSDENDNTCGIKPEEFEHRITFMSMNDDIDLTKVKKVTGSAANDEVKATRGCSRVPVSKPHTEAQKFVDMSADDSDREGQAQMSGNRFAVLGEDVELDPVARPRRRLVLVSQNPDFVGSDHEWDPDTESIGGASEVWRGGSRPVIV